MLITNAPALVAEPLPGSNHAYCGIPARDELTSSAITSSAVKHDEKSNRDTNSTEIQNRELQIQQDEFHWYYTLAEMDTKFIDIYNSGKRLADRARWNANLNHYELFLHTTRSRQPVPVSNQFINTVRNHIERALSLRYADYIFYPDMGHAHLLIPIRFYEDTIKNISVDKQHEVYNKVLAHPDTKFLYHTAEQLNMLDESNELLQDRYTRWRYFTRNLVAANHPSGHIDIHHNLDSIGNTVCQAPVGYYLWSAGIYISASKYGCFPYRDERSTRYFDISLTDFPHTGTAPAVANVERVQWGANDCGGL